MLHRETCIPLTKASHATQSQVMRKYTLLSWWGLLYFCSGKILCHASVASPLPEPQKKQVEHTFATWPTEPHIWAQLRSGDLQPEEIKEYDFKPQSFVVICYTATVDSFSMSFKMSCLTLISGWHVTQSRPIWSPQDHKPKEVLEWPQPQQPALP